MAPPRAISLRNVTPSIPENPIHLEELKQDLAQMRCERLLDRPWILKREQLVQEMLLPERPNMFNTTVRDRPQLWTADLWRQTYRFPRGESGLSNQTEGHHEGRFMHEVYPKDGYSVSDCRVDRHRRLLEFMIPIVHPDKPTRVTITIGNTIFGALDGGREVDWEVVFRDMVQRLAKGVGKPKPTPICPFLFHLYEGQGLLTVDEDLDYWMAKEMAGYRITPDPDSQPGSDEDEPTPAPAPSPRPGPSRTPNKRRKSTYKVPSGSPPVRYRGPSSPVPPEPQPREQQPNTRPEEGPEWVDKPFASIARGFRQARDQYESMEQALDQIGSELGISPEEIIPTIRTLPKAQEVDGLRIQIASLISENGRLETQVANRNRRAEAAEAQTLVAASQASAAKARAAAAEARAAAAEEARAFAESESTKWHGVSRKFFDFLGFPDDVVTKARIFDQCMKKPEAVSATKILQMLVDFSARVENLLKESAFQLGDRGHEAGPSEQRPDPVPGLSRLERPSPPTAIPGAPPTGAPSASTPRPEATPSRPEAAATPNIPDPTQQEPIPDSLNTDNIPSLHQWGTEDLPESGTPATGSRGPTDPVIRITPGSIPRSQPRRPGSVQANLFGGNPDDPAVQFHRHMRQLADELRAETGEEQRISGDKDDPVIGNPVEEAAAEVEGEPEAGNQEEEEDEAADEDEDEEEEEDLGYGNSGDDDNDSLPASSHRPVTRSTSKKQSVSRLKRKAFRNKSGPGSSSRKRTRRQ